MYRDVNREMYRHVPRTIDRCMPINARCSNPRSKARRVKDNAPYPRSTSHATGRSRPHQPTGLTTDSGNGFDVLTAGHGAVATAKLPLSSVCRFESAVIRAIRGQKRLGIRVDSRHSWETDCSDFRVLRVFRGPPTWRVGDNATSMRLTRWASRAPRFDF
jgi:hypothetical protein